MFKSLIFFASQSDIRQRNLKSTFTANYQGRPVEDGKYHEKKINYPLSDSLLLFTLILIVTTFVAVIVIDKKLPYAIKETEEWKYPNRFIAERSRNFLVKLTDLGPRLAGSDVNEVHAVNLLVKEIESIISSANAVHNIELDVQRASGAYSLQFLDGLTIAYHDMQNVVVKFGSKNNSPHSLLINCHFDSAIDSPGMFKKKVK